MRPAIAKAAAPPAKVSSAIWVRPTPSMMTAGWITAPGKDRVEIVEGGAHLKEFRLKPDSPTRRVVAMYCSSPMFADFTPGHWLSIFRGRLGAQAPKYSMRLMTKDRLEGVELAGDIPACKTMPPSFLFKLVASWTAMGFRRPKITW